MSCQNNFVVASFANFKITEDVDSKNFETIFVSEDIVYMFLYMSMNPLTVHSVSVETCFFKSSTNSFKDF
jgi:hypothetical protein